MPIADEASPLPAILPGGQEFWNATTPRGARTRLMQALRFELLGPETPDEELRESPLNRYSTGTLAPFGTEVPDDERDEQLTDSGGEEESGAVEFGPPMSQAITPSSIGLSFLVPASVQHLEVHGSWGDYRVREVPGLDEVELESEDLKPDLVDSPPTETPKRSRQRPRWVRAPRNPEPLLIQLKADKGLQKVAIVKADGVTVEHLCRRLGDRLAVSVFLVNRRSRGDRVRPPVDQWIFQPILTVRSPSGEPVFMPRDIEPAIANSDRDRESNRLLFRRRREFAVGHGCAAQWKESNDVARAIEVRTELLPAYELPRVDAPPLDSSGLKMEALANARSGEELTALIEPLLGGYKSWIDSKQSGLEGLPASVRDVARFHLEDCRTALTRMRSGVLHLGSNGAARQAFQFANQAMLLQRSHTLWARARKRDLRSAPLQPLMEGEWRPFQLAFILLNLPGLIDPESDERHIADLLWFPTGGGKTEAYLGLAAFTMAFRRLRTLAGMRTDAGLAVLMRYTLRLLTIQQFQRAATLLCACEVLRRERPETWGDYRFSIGLWLGRDGTPNSDDDARSSLARVQQDPSEEGPNPCQLESCPWCGETLTPLQYWTDGEALRTRVACPRSECAFSKANSEIGLPVLVVDQEIYRECPTMIIATVDKFAQMPWNGEVQSLFGFVDRECDRCGFITPSGSHVKAHRASGTSRTPSVIRSTERLAPPDLIIQDELHLISGPLGTLVGLYESAVDFLSAYPGKIRMVRPKVIASTATVRRAFEQVHSLFDRGLRVFPPPGLEPEDSFFAVEQTVGDDSPGRLYLGVCCPGKSMKTAYVRVAASLLSAVAGLRRNPILAEPYTTLLSYFNSLRELGGAIRLIDDDIPARLGQLKARGLPQRNRPNYRELTSRIKQQEIPHLLRLLETRHDAPRTSDDPLPLDAVLASNMISVGVDIDRLGLMTVTGQPKTTAEYIQATSRVGRQTWGPGLVVTIYNWTRPRDLSHYERFRHYHATLYRNVEAVSATPFSSRALDKGLRGTFVAMTRLGSDGWSAEGGAAMFDPQDPRVARVIEALRKRAASIGDAATSIGLIESLKGLGDEWWGYRRNPLRYSWRSPNPAQLPSEDVLLRVPDGGQIGHWPAPQSLREVEEHSLVRVLGLNAQ